MRYIFVFSLITLLTACTTYVYLPSHDTPAAQTVYSEGVPLQYQSTDPLDIWAGLISYGDRNFSLHLDMRSYAPNGITFQPEQIRVVGYNSRGEGRDFRVYAADEWVRYRNRRNAAIAAGVVTAVVITAVIISENSDNHASSSEKGPVSHHSDVYFNAPIIITEPVPDTRYAVPGGYLLLSNTLYEGESMEGIVKIIGNSGYIDHFDVLIPVNGQERTFKFSGRQQQR